MYPRGTCEAGHVYGRTCPSVVRRGREGSWWIRGESHAGLVGKVEHEPFCPCLRDGRRDCDPGRDGGLPLRPNPGIFGMELLEPVRVGRLRSDSLSELTNVVCERLPRRDSSSALHKRLVRICLHALDLGIGVAGGTQTAIRVTRTVRVRTKSAMAAISATGRARAARRRPSTRSAARSSPPPACASRGPSWLGARSSRT